MAPEGDERVVVVVYLAILGLAVKKDEVAAEESAVEVIVVVGVVVAAAGVGEVVVRDLVDQVGVAVEEAGHAEEEE